MDERPENIVDAEFEVVSDPWATLPSPPRLRLPLWAVIGRVFSAVMIVLVVWDIISDGVPSQAMRHWIFGL